MNIKHTSDVPGIDMAPRLPGVTMQVLVSPNDGARNFVMRRFTIEPGAATAHHQHNWEHEVYVLEGRGLLLSSGRETSLRPGDVVRASGKLVAETVSQSYRTADVTIRRLVGTPGHPIALS